MSGREELIGGLRHTSLLFSPPRAGKARRAVVAREEVERLEHRAGETSVVVKRSRLSRVVLDMARCHLWAEVERIEQKEVLVAAWAAVRTT